MWSGHGPPQQAKREIKGKPVENKDIKKDKDGNPLKEQVNVCVWNIEVPDPHHHQTLSPTIKEYSHIKLLLCPQNLRIKTALQSAYNLANFYYRLLIYDLTEWTANSFPT